VGTFDDLKDNADGNSGPAEPSDPAIEPRVEAVPRPARGRHVKRPEDGAADQ
jgi:hypothetical protein